MRTQVRTGPPDYGSAAPEGAQPRRHQAADRSFALLADEFHERLGDGGQLLAAPVLGAGLSKVAGKLFRIGRLGDLNELMLLGALAGTEMAMADVGIELELGSGVAAAQDYWRRTDPVPKKRVARSEVMYASHSTGSINA